MDNRAGATAGPDLRSSHDPDRGELPRPIAALGGCPRARSPTTCSGRRQRSAEQAWALGPGDSAGGPRLGARGLRAPAAAARPRARRPGRAHARGPGASTPRSSSTSGLVRHAGSTAAPDDDPASAVRATPGRCARSPTGWPGQGELLLTLAEHPARARRPERRDLGQPGRVPPSPPGPARRPRCWSRWGAATPCPRWPCDRSPPRWPRPSSTVDRGGAPSTTIAWPRAVSLGQPAGRWPSRAPTRPPSRGAPTCTAAGDRRSSSGSRVPSADTRRAGQRFHGGRPPLRRRAAPARPGRARRLARPTTPSPA